MAPSSRGAILNHGADLLRGDLRPPQLSPEGWQVAGAETPGHGWHGARTLASISSLSSSQRATDDLFHRCLSAASNPAPVAQI